MLMYYISTQQIADSLTKYGTNLLPLFALLQKGHFSINIHNNYIF